jgi:hypothetical protein
MTERVTLMDGVNFGTGVDFSRLAAVGTAVDFDSPTLTAGQQGQGSSSFFAKKVEARHEYESALGLSGEIGASFKLFGGSAKASFAENCAFQQYSVFCVARIQVSNAVFQIAKPRFNQDAINLFQNGKEDRFHEQYGDRFALGIVSGGEYCVSIEIHSDSDEAKKKISEHIDAHGGVFGIGAHGEQDFSQSFKELNKNFSITVFSYISGGVGSVHEIDPDAVLRKAAAFSQEVQGDKGHPYEVILQDYKILTLPASPNWVDMIKVKDALRLYSNMRDTLMDYENKLAYIERNPEQFNILPSFNMGDLRKQILDAVEAISDMASRCVAKPLDCDLSAASSVKMPSPQWPTRKQLVPRISLRASGKSAAKSDNRPPPVKKGDVGQQQPSPPPALIKLPPIRHG